MPRADFRPEVGCFGQVEFEHLRQDADIFRSIGDEVILSAHWRRLAKNAAAHLPYAVGAIMLQHYVLHKGRDGGRLQPHGALGQQRLIGDFKSEVE